MPQLTLQLLGQYQVKRGGNRLLSRATVKERALLAYVAVRSEQAHARPMLAGMLWPDLADGDALRNLCQALSMFCSLQRKAVR